MDQIKIGKFIAALRKEKGMTQEQLGQKLGVTNKTVSRWENGNYMPDVETLLMLSKEFGVSMNELAAGERISAEDFVETADCNLAAALNSSVFTLKEKLEFFKRKWKREHLSIMIVCAVAWLGLLIALKFQNVEPALLGAAGGLLAMLFYTVLYNRMMAYAEKHAYLPDCEQADGKK